MGYLLLVCSNIVPITPQYVHLVVYSGGKYNHILATLLGRNYGVAVSRCSTFGGRN